ncbi:protein root UVB sensitive 4 isoform X3 [Beta vulgaris subsp. vulgaris]|uniref:protein root UVB sensitive 4 isoform X3 n=1 Tax=Beta vulgaris subsp. vulgaris TaxID=3555 RepID=UPI0020375FD1|nr:protein root UVB sensitive 4 isoform X3 [Beta vulgaris subsp. vulgaris]
MQSSSTISLNSQSLQFSWKPSLPRNFSLQTFNSNPTSQFKTFSLFTSFKTLPNSDSQQPIIKKNQSLSKTDLPVVIRRNGKDFKYFWDGNSLELVCVDDEIPTTLFESFEEGIKKFLTVVRDFFIPKQVTENYIEYVKWKFLHRVFSSSLQVLATQAMFRAIGVGYAQSLPSAAAMNWVLKDGLGRLSRCIYTSCVGSAFDTNLKRVRFATSVMFSLSIGVELMTPAFPHCFLLLASVANIAKQISLACYLATGVRLPFIGVLHWLITWIQTVCFDNLGLLLAASINVVLKNNERLQAGLPFVVYPIFSAIDLCGIYQSLKHVHLQTFTKDRLELVLDKWIQSGYVPSPAEVSKLEGIDLLNFVDEVETGRKKGEWPIRIGGLDPKRQIPLLTMLTMRSLSREDFYFICLETTCGLPSEKQGILLSLREGARTEDIIVGLLQACYIRHALLPSSSKWENIVEDCDISHSKAMKWFQLTQDSKSLAQLDLSTLHEQMLSSSWIAKNILLGTQEQTRYDFVDKNDV